MENTIIKKIISVLISLTGFAIICSALFITLIHSSDVPKFDYILIVIGATVMCLPLIINKLSAINFNDKTAIFDKDYAEKLKEDVVEGVKSSILDIAAVGSEFMDHYKAFDLAKEILEKYSDEETVAIIELRLISVAMCYTWEFVENDFVSIARNNNKVQFHWKIAIVDPEYFNRFKLDTKQYDWNAQSVNMPDKISSLEAKLHSEGVKNVSFETFLYKAIPQWHGLLIDRKHLLIGRSDWELMTETGNPRLTVGSNPYRYHNYTDAYGQLIINIFRHWFGFYAGYSKFVEPMSNNSITKKSS